MKSDRILDETSSPHMHRWYDNRTGLSNATRADQQDEQASDNQSSEHLLHHHRLLSKAAYKGRAGPAGSSRVQCRLSVLGMHLSHLGLSSCCFTICLFVM